MEGHFENYLKLAEESSPGISSSITTTVNALIPQYIKTFSYKDHITGLLLGNVQSGKTGQVFGLISAAADEGFNLFIFLTTDNVYLHEQTHRRALRTLDTFNVCGEDNELQFIEKRMRQPVIVIIKKNTNVLKRWRDNLSSSRYCEGRPIFIIDDEGDAASLNTKINKRAQSAINSHLDSIKKLANSSIYLQVTATPQSLLLQSSQSEWKPSFIYYFPPGPGYLGGDLFYSDPPSPYIRLTKENELDDLRDDEKHITEGLRLSIQAFLITSAHIIAKEKKKCCNFLVHPSVRIIDHNWLASKIGQYLNQLLTAESEGKLKTCLKESWEDLQKTKADLISFDKAYEFIKNVLIEQKIRICIMNSLGDKNADCSDGMNIVVGGNSLGRGVTFPSLQTVYYCRTAKSPQADTFWQHSRMFGYDRSRDLMRIFIPPSLLKLFTELSGGNRAILGQARSGGPESINLLYPPGIRPTRPNVVDKKLLDVIAGGVNYFPNFPKRKHVKKLDDLLESYNDTGTHEVTLNNLIELLGNFESERKDDWSAKAFINCVKALKHRPIVNKAVLIVRRKRSITKGTGTLLSPNDRSLGDSIKEYPVLTLYRINGEQKKGWDGHPLWIPNIKFPEEHVFYRVDK